MCSPGERVTTRCTRAWGTRLVLRNRLMGLGLNAALPLLISGALGMLSEYQFAHLSNGDYRLSQIC